jgi:hypothetical protein
VLPSPCDDITARVFSALYSDYDLRIIGGTYLVVPKGTPCYTGTSLGDIARQISDREPRRPLQPSPGEPACPHDRSS